MDKKNKNLKSKQSNCSKCNSNKKTNYEQNCNATSSNASMNNNSSECR